MTGASINPIQSQQASSINQSSQAGQAAKNVQNMEESLTMLKADLTELSDESLNFAAAMKTDSGKESGKAEALNQKAIKKEEGTERLDQAAMAVMTDEVDEETKLRKKKEKAKKFEEKLAMVGTYLQNVDLEALPEDVKEAIQEFERNLDRIKQQKGKLKQLEAQLEHFAALLEQDKKGQ
jgi:chromosome segregation ATPase